MVSLPYGSGRSMHFLAIRSERARHGIQREELAAAGIEVAVLFLLFIIAFTGRSAFGEGIRLVLSVLSVTAGALGAVAGLLVIGRSVVIRASRVGRFLLGAFMTFIGLYTVVHVLS